MAFVTCHSAQLKPGCAARAGVTTRAEAPKKIIRVLLANFVAAGAAVADEMSIPSFDDLKSMQYDTITGPAVSAAVESTQTFDSSGLGDAAPLIGGLAVGIAIVGAGIYGLTSLGPKGPRIQSISAARAFDLLANEEDSQLLDIRPKAEIKETGAPDLRSVQKSVLSLPYSPTQNANKPTSGTVTIGWPEKVARLPKISEETAVVLLDLDGSEAAGAARELAGVYPEAETIYYVSGGASGTRGWLESELPWREAVKLGFNFDTLKALDFSGVAAGTEKIVEKYRENPNLVNGSVAAVAVAGASVFLLSEVETILEVVGVLAAGQFLAQRLLFANDRQRTFNELKKLITEKIAAGEAGKDLTRLATTLLDSSNVDDLVDSTRSAAKTLDAPSDDVKRAAQAVKQAAAQAESDPVQENVRDARDWIQTWKAKQKQTVKAL